MHESKSDRKVALKVIGSLYSRKMGVDQTKCVYCGDDRQCLDHVPPIVYTYRYLNIQQFLKTGGELALYPACLSCNNILGKKALATLDDRRAYLYKWYLDKSNHAAWSDDDLAELGSNLLSMIASHEQKCRDMLAKLRKVERMLAED